jgi:hypothetical protein
VANRLRRLALISDRHLVYQARSACAEYLLLPIAEPADVHLAVIVPSRRQVNEGKLSGQAPSMELDEVFKAVVRNPEQPGTKNSGATTLSRSWPITIAKIDTGAANPFISLYF